MHYSSKILCMYSGGLDSTGALWQLVHAPEYAGYEILVHHVHLVNATRRFNAEKQALEKIIPLLRKYTSRQLYFSSTIMDFGFMGGKVPIDADVYGFVAANLVSLDSSIRLIALGRTLDDKNSGGSPLIQIVDCVDKAIQLVNYGRKYSSSAKCITPVVNLTKQQIWELLPVDIRELTWSCRRPRYEALADGRMVANPCLSCHACEARQQLK